MIEREGVREKERDGRCGKTEDDNMCERERGVRKKERSEREHGREMDIECQEVKEVVGINGREESLGWRNYNRKVNIQTDRQTQPCVYVLIQSASEGHSD